MDKTQIRLLEHKATGALFNTVNLQRSNGSATTLPSYYSLALTKHEKENSMLQQQHHHQPSLGHRFERYAVI